MSDTPLLDSLLTRRSASLLTAPGPSRETLDLILRAAGSVPDHGLLRPFRFIVAEGDGRERFGDALAAAAAELTPGAPEARLSKVRDKAFRSPTIVALVFSPKPGKIELWEQSATAACAGYAVLLAAHAVGVGAVWKSVPFTKGQALSDRLGLTPGEEMLGWIHLGTSALDAPPAARLPLVLAEVVTSLEREGLVPYAEASSQL